ncbi:hypothetical protein [Gimesia sp.]|uniref:hypothetical protein n=1 Tax=Gimesia sp. TaxID=2024833 RepID=UPI0025BB5436|nr:hypothetical protein [Gimesia sp.]|tara:strand:+ start:12011 stop:12334 length:324 start_codon:yes stop_codon:yes gene_type:complete
MLKLLASWVKDAVLLPLNQHAVPQLLKPAVLQPLSAVLQLLKLAVLQLLRPAVLQLLRPAVLQLLSLAATLLIPAAVIVSSSKETSCEDAKIVAVKCSIVAKTVAAK